MGFNVAVLLLLLFLAPLLLYFLKSLNIQRLLIISGAVVIGARLVSPLIDDLFLYLLMNGLILLGTGIFLPCFLTIYFALNGKFKFHTVGGAVLAAPALALLTDFLLRAMGDTLDVSVSGWIGAHGDTVVAPFWLVFALSLIALGALLRMGAIVVSDLPGVRAEQRSARKVSALLPGLAYGLLLTLLFTFLGYPDAMIRWTDGDYTLSVTTATLWLCIFAIAIHLDAFREFIFRRSTLIPLHLIQLAVIADVIYLHVGIAQYLGGLALGVLLLDMYILFLAVGSQDYSAGPLIRMITIGQFVFLLMFFVSVFALVTIHAGPVGALFKDRLPLTLMGAAIALVLIVLVYSGRVHGFPFQQTDAVEHTSTEGGA